MIQKRVRVGLLLPWYASQRWVAGDGVSVECSLQGVSEVCLVARVVLWCLASGGLRSTPLVSHGLGPCHTHAVHSHAAPIHSHMRPVPGIVSELLPPTLPTS